MVITSRNPRWDDIAASVEIGEFTRAESIALLQTRLTHFTDAEANKIAKATGDLPLAVDQAAALLLDTGWNVSAYLDLLGHSAERLLNQRNDAAGYRLSVAASWQVTFDELTATTPAAVQLLTLAAWLAPERIPLRMFTDHATMLPRPLADAAGDPLAWTHVLAVLRRRAMARVGSDSLLLHRIPAALLRTHSLVTAPEDGWAALAIKLLRTAAPTDPWNQPATWPAWQALLPHLLTATARAPDAVADEVDWLTDRLATYLQASGEPRAARPHHQRAFDRCKARLGADHPVTLRYANRLALNLHALGEYDQSYRLNQEIFERRSRVLGPDDRYTLGSASNIALDLHALGQHQQARDLDQDTLSNRRRVLGEDDRDTLLSASNLARDLHALGEFRLAYDLDQDTLDRRRRVLGEDHIHTLASANNLARDLWNLGEYQQAHDVDKNTLDRLRRVLGEDHPETLRSANNLACDLHALGEFRLAYDLDQETLDRRRRVLGEDHPHTLTSIENLARDLDSLKERKEDR